MQPCRDPCDAALSSGLPSSCLGGRLRQSGVRAAGGLHAHGSVVLGLLDLIMMSWPGPRPALCPGQQVACCGQPVPRPCQAVASDRLVPGGIRCAGWLALG